MEPNRTPPFDLVLWSAPHDVDADAAASLVREWLEAGGDPGRSPFEPTTDVGWFQRELLENLPDLQTVSDAVPRVTKVPIWASGTDEAPARVVAIRLTTPPARDELDTILSLAMKYDLVVFDPRRGTVNRPLAAMAAYASATFWPRGAIRSAIAGAVGAAIAILAWVIGIPILSGLAIVVGVFLVVLCVATFVHELRVRARRG